ncbi:DUF4190 domain-containing protein [Herbiconiux sp. CPCC 205763]|uniref:DUF4190 domain-containing protein n=1 Tax=Herbiconiux aconitum TaxID=2970913 RepID=A0ABT2GPT7_9MICO|nr:DUF4190 domain-containing protein [Herbiconiux aconitum]MCS5718235.1 DUF4190 domain-containing protein [Herbiconiux aconitum]
MSDTNNPTPDAGEPPVPPVTSPETGSVPPVPPAPPAAPASTPPPAPGYQQPVPGYPAQPPAPGYQQPGGYQQPPTGGYPTPPTGGYQTPPPAPGYGQAPPPGYQPPPGQQPYYGYQAPATPPMNTLAIVTIILAFVFSIAGIVTGHIALKQIDRTGESGRGLAKAGLIISYVFTGLAVLGVIVYVIFIVVLLAAAGTSSMYSTY